MLLKFNFFSEDIPFRLHNSIKVKRNLIHVAVSESNLNGAINYIFCSDKYLFSLNIHFLKHNTFTDVITFESHNEKDQILSDIFVSIDRVTENAKKYDVPFEKELHRVMIHGLLHLLGYSDKKVKDKKLMKQKEDFYLSCFTWNRK